MGAVSDSIRKSAEAFGAEIRTDARVKQIIVRGGRAIGVALEDGTELRAPVLVTTVHPKIAFLDMIELPDFVALPGTDMQAHHTGSVELCFSPQYAEQAFQDAHMERKGSVAPFVDGTIPTTLDKKLAPEGTHGFSMFRQWVPDDWTLDPHGDELDGVRGSNR